MNSDDRRSRRSTLRLVGATTIGAFLAGCGELGGDEDDGADDTDETDDVDWDDVDTIRLEADSNGWIGREPDGIADAENPTLELYAGREYDLVWENGDGEYHNLSLHSKDDAVEEQLEDDERIDETDLLEDEGETVEHTFEATEEFEGYVCEMHPQEMAGEISILEDDENDA